MNVITPPNVDSGTKSNVKFGSDGHMIFWTAEDLMKYLTKKTKQ